MEQLGFGTSIIVLFVLLTIWSIVWTGLGLWKAARANDKVWFVIMLLINTVGILEIIYIYLVLPRRQKKTMVSDSEHTTQNLGM